MSKKNKKQRNLSVNRSNESKSALVELDRTHMRYVTALGLMLAGVIVGLSAINRAGVAGAWIFKIMDFVLGLGAYALPLILIALGVHRVRAYSEPAKIFHRIIGIIFFLGIVGLLETVQALAPKFVGGGIVGQLISFPLISLFDKALALIILIVVLIICAIIIFSWVPKIPNLSFIKKNKNAHDAEEDENGDEDEEVGEEVRQEDGSTSSPQANSRREKQKTEPIVAGIIGKEKNGSTRSPQGKEESIVIDIHNRLPSTYTAPPLSLLNRSKGTPAVGDIKEVAETITRTLANFNIEVSMDEITVGPSITRYAMKPSVGTKLSKIMGLENELSLALAAHPIRIEAPIPGKSLVGIEIPNREKSMIGLGSMLDEADFKNTNKPLLVSLGKGVSGKPYFADIARMPHMLIAGATGAGKSVTVHNIIISLLYAHGPEELRFIMIDPKRVELTNYDKIPHLLTPVIKQAKKAILALKWAAGEMDRRYDVLEQHKVRDIDSYHTTIVQPAYTMARQKNANNKAGNVELPESEEEHLPERMPYIVVVIDELADLMQLYPRELEASIVRLAQMSRAVGIHLLLSTQRPSVNVITGLIKANIPTRLALRVSSQIDSRTILDHSGAEMLLGRGDMLYKGGDMPNPERIQCANVSEEEIKKVVSFIIKNNMSDLYDEIDLPETADSDRSMASGSFDDDDGGDDLFEEAREIVIHAGKASTSYIQRKLRVGYSRAARLMDMLEDAGVIGPGQGSKPRDVLIQSPEGEKKSFGDSDGESEKESLYEFDDRDQKE